MTKGKPILVEGRLRFDSWTGQDGQKRSKLSVVAENFQFVGARGDQPAGAGAGAGAPQERSAPPAEAPAPPLGADDAPPTGESIPF
jgi:single-strand DNA-binding protein